MAAKRDQAWVAAQAYPDVAAAMHGLLGDVCSTVASTGESFVIVGGWSPFLWNSAPIPHPGTRDVDVLFEAGATKGQLEDVCGALLNRGYFLSAKHGFQLGRLVAVADEVLGFHVDLLHPGIGPDSEGAGMFVKHLDLNAPLTELQRQMVGPMSIATQDAGVIFKEGLFDPYQYEGIALDGNQIGLDIPPMSEPGLLLTKAISVSSPKRERDAFDIALAVAQARDPAALSHDLHRLSHSSRRIASLIHRLLEELTDEKRPAFRSRVRAYVDDDEIAEGLVQSLDELLRVVAPDRAG